MQLGNIWNEVEFEDVWNYLRKTYSRQLKKKEDYQETYFLLRDINNNNNNNNNILIEIKYEKNSWNIIATNTDGKKLDVKYMDWKTWLNAEIEPGLLEAHQIVAHCLFNLTFLSNSENQKIEQDNVDDTYFTEILNQFDQYYNLIPSHLRYDDSLISQNITRYSYQLKESVKTISNNIDEIESSLSFLENNGMKRIRDMINLCTSSDIPIQEAIRMVYVDKS
jgi:hypothetical protein